jgi:biopolymer transport protein ExbB
VYEFLLKGGVLVAPIVACSVIALAVFLERLWVLKQSRIIPSVFVGRIETLVRERRLQDALLLCRENASPMAQIMAAAIENAAHSRARIKEAVEEAGKFAAAMLERHVEWVGTCSAVSPLLGLLGTVFGMIEVFQGVERGGLGDPAFFAQGIWTALITTAVGLTVAIPAYVFYKHLLARVDRAVVEMEERSLHLVELLTREAT